MTMMTLIIMSMILRSNMKFFFSSLIMFYMLSLMFNYLSYIEWYSIYFTFGLNFYSVVLLILTLWVFSLIIIETSGVCYKLNLLLLVILLLSFTSMSMFCFYFFFEVSLVIMFILILKWGKGSMRLLAGYYFVFYTLFFSFPLLVFIFLMSSLSNMCMMNFLELMGISMNNYMFLYMMMSFLVKIPMFSFHGWLLKAHVEAPVYGSMILASILLKLGTYGLLRLVLVFYINVVNMNFYILMFSLFGSLLLSLICLQQVDMKILVAYSSVVHMGLLLSGMMTLLKLGFVGGYLLMIAHGLCSSGLFYLVNVCYCETNSRLMIVNKGMMIYMSSLALIWFLFCSSNMSAPVSLNLVGEVILLMSLIVWLKYLIYLLFFFCFFSFLYSLYLFSYVQHGEMNFYLMIKPSFVIQNLILLMHWVPLNIMFLDLVFFY